MRVLVIGQGGREHALAWKLAQSPSVHELYVAPGNGGTGQIATNLDLQVTAVDELAEWAEHAGIDLSVVGPEAALAAGVVDAFRARGLSIFGPTRAAARLESSKGWAKAFMTRHRIPTAAYRDCTDGHEAAAYLRGLEDDRFPVVIKADGLAAGKGVHIARDRAEALAVIAGTPAGGPGRVIVEAFLEGFEVSFLAISDGSSVRPLCCAHDYKRAHEGDQGPMTGGMGAYSPIGMEAKLTPRVMAEIVEPAIRGMAAEGIPYQGILYAGLMLTAEGLQVLEFNARFGDPETQVLLPRWRDDLYAVLATAAAGRLAELPPLSWSDDTACGVVLAAAGYPDSYQTGQVIVGLHEVESEALVFHGGTRAGSGDQDTQTVGGRVIAVVGRGADLAGARAVAYRNASRITFPGCWYRADIGGAAVGDGEQGHTGDGLCASGC